MGHAPARLVVLGVLVVLSALLGCTRTVEGVAVAGAGPVPTGSAAGPGGLIADAVADECVLDRAQAAALAGRPVQAPRQREIRRADGSTTSGCYVDSTDAYPTPVLALNVYRPRGGTAAERVTAAGGKELVGVGSAATLLDTATGPVLQLAAPTYLVTIAVLDGAPSEPAWRAAATAALGALPDR